MLIQIVFLLLPLSIIFMSLSFRNLQKRIDVMIDQHWNLLDYVSSNSVTSKDFEVFNEAKKGRRVSQ